MKKLFYFAAAAVALAACAKNEVIPVNSGENQEITFNVAPKTKAGTQTFKTTWNFKAYAYYYAGGSASATPELYINKAIVSYQTITTETGNKSVWKSNTPYYWPKNGSLTFFAWTSLKEDVATPENTAVSTFDGVECDATTGIKAEDYDVTANKNIDFLVADVAANQTKNINTYGHDGVPTLFRHTLSYVIFNVVTDKEYPSTKKFELKSITFKDIANKGNYQQIPASPDTKNWTVTGTKEQAYYTAPKAATGVIITEAPTTLTSNATQNYYLPQSFATSGSVVVEYWIETNENGNKSTDKVTKTIDMNDLFTSWDMGKKYTVTLTFKLDEILWDPAVEDWTTVGGTVSSDVK